MTRSPTFSVEPKGRGSWAVAFSFVAPAVGAALIVAAERYLGLGILSILEENKIQAPVILGLAIIYAALLIGYFVVLREAVVDRNQLQAQLRADASEAEQHQDYVRELLQQIEQEGTPRVDSASLAARGAAGLR